MIPDQTFFRSSSAEKGRGAHCVVRNKTFSTCCLYTNHNHYRRTVKAAKGKVDLGRLSLRCRGTIGYFIRGCISLLEGD